MGLWSLAETVAWLPVAAIQGRRLRRETPVLPEASGERAGVIGSGRPLRLVSVGDSTIAGVGLDDVGQTVTAQLARRLADSHTVSWRAVGKSGATARTATEELAPQVAGVACDVLLISVGVNDVLRGNTSRGFTRDVTRLVQALRAHTGPVFVVLSGMPPIEHFPLLPRAVRRVAGHRGRALDAGLSRVAAALPDVVHHHLHFDTADTSAFAPDGFHPGPKAHALWAEQLVPVVSTGPTPTSPHGSR